MPQLIELVLLPHERDNQELVRQKAARQAGFRPEQISHLEILKSSLDARSRHIIESRWLKNDDGTGSTLHELADEYGVSAERIRQIESAALKKMKGSLSSFA